MREAKIFVSYSSKDAKAATELVSELEARGLQCWIAPRNIRPGDDYDEAIVAAILACRALVVLVSTDSIASRHVRSEVVRASSEGKTIYPVRLIDIEVAGGLQFHLELSQWIDFFPNVTTESYDALAEAIRLGKSARTPTVRHRFDPRRWTLMTLAGMAALIFGALGANWGYDAWQMHQATKQAEEEMARYEAQQADRERERLEAGLRSLDVNPTFSMEDSGSYLRRAYLMGSSAVSGAFEAEVVLNGGTPEPYPIDGTVKRIRIDAANLTSLVFRILGPDGALVKEVDKTDKLREELASGLQRFSNAVAQVAGDDHLTCFIAGCSFRYHSSSFCTPVVTGVSIEQNGRRHDVPSEYCSGPGMTRDYCVTAQDLPFRPVPGEIFEIVFRLIDGSERRVQKTIRDRWLINESVYHEVPAAGDDPAPVFAATYDAPDVIVGGFRFAVGWTECSPEGQLLSENSERGSYLFADLDGHGLSRLERQPFFGAQFNPGDTLGNAHPTTPLRLPAGPQTIRIAFGDETGIKAGPWSYAFDPGDVVRATTARGAIPEVACTGDQRVPRYATYAAQRAQICMPVQRYAFFDVAAVEFGPRPDDFSTRIEVDFDAETYLAAECDTFKAKCPPFIFEVPESWSAVNSRVVMKDGRILSQMRHQLQR